MGYSLQVSGAGSVSGEGILEDNIRVARRWTSRLLLIAKQSVVQDSTVVVSIDKTCVHVRI